MIKYIKYILSIILTIHTKKTEEKEILFIKPKRKVNKVFIHCSASDVKSHDDISVIRDWHLKRKFKEIGYHYFITKSGEIQKGRSLEKVPASQKGHNRYSISICVSGLKNFTDISLKRTKLLCQIINRHYESISFHGHKEISNKTCPNFDYRKLLNLDKKGYMK